MRILWIGPNYRHRYNFGHEMLPDAVARKRSVEVIRYGRGCLYWDLGTHVPDLEKVFNPDIIILQHARHSRDFTGWEETSSPCVCLIVDYFPRNHQLKNQILSQGFDLALFPERYMITRAQAFQNSRDLPSRLSLDWLPFSIDPYWFRPRPELPKLRDVMILYSIGRNQPNRDTVASVILKMKKVRSFVKVLRTARGKITHEDYTRLINTSRLAVASNDTFGSVNLKHLEYMACGVPVVTEEAGDFSEMGLIPWEHYIPYEKPGNLPKLIRQVLENNDLLTEIGMNACRQVLKSHTTQVRSTDLIHKLKELINATPDSKPE